MRKYISLFTAFIILFISICPGFAFAEEDGSQNVINDLYSITLPSWAKVLSENATDNFTTVISANDLSFTTKISFETITNDDINSVREYLSDYESNNSAIFDKILDLRAESYAAVEKSYSNSSTFFPMDKEYSELNFKIIDKQVQELFGVRTFSIMYNTLDATMNRISEYCKIDMYIPTYDKGVYEINIMIPRDQVSDKTLMKLAELLNSLKLAGHPQEDKVPLILVANDNIEKAAAGIYPAYTFKNYNMKPFYSKEMGISFYYPDFLIATDNITNFGNMKNASFKIDPYTTFNIMTADSSEYSLNEAVAWAFSSIEAGTSITKVNVLDSPNGNIYEIIYNYTKNSVKYQKRNYILSSNGTTVVYSLMTTAKNPAYSLDNIIIRILITTKPFNIQENNTSNSVTSYTYSSRNLDDISLNLPDNFKAVNINGNNFKITSPDVNTFQIYVYEEELNREIDFETASKLASSNNAGIVKSPFAFPVSSSQNTYLGGRVAFKQDSKKIYRLSKYLDSDNRLHYCYTVSIAKGDKLYSMLIDINSLLYKEDGKVGKTMPGLLDDIAQSFSLK